MRGEGHHDLHANDIRHTHKRKHTLIHAHPRSLAHTTHLQILTNARDTHTHIHTHTQPHSAFVWSLGMECINVSLCEWHRATQLLCLLSYMTQCHSYVAVSNGEL